MKSKLFFLAAILLFQLNSKAQPNSGLKFTTISQAGLLAGGSNNDWQLQMVNGLSYKTFYAGIGLGIDNYYFKTIPFFIATRKNILKQKQTPFVYADIGTNFPWNKNATSSPWQKGELNNGLYFDAGIGYSWPLVKNLALLVSAGYSEKYMHETKTYVWITENSLPEYYDYTFRRLTIKAGLSF